MGRSDLSAGNKTVKGTFNYKTSIISPDYVSFQILPAALIYLCGRRGGFDKAYRKSGLPDAGRASAATAAAPVGSPGMVETSYANASAGGAGIWVACTLIKSPGKATISSFGGHDNDTLRNFGYFPDHHLTVPSILLPLSAREHA